MIGWGFMDEVNISPPPTLGRFFLTQQLIYQRKIQKHHVSLGIFVSDTSIARKLYLPGLEKNHFSYINTHTLFWIRFWYLCCSKPKSVLGSGPYQGGKKISAFYNDWENSIAYGKNPSKARPWQLASAIRLIL